MRSQNLYIDLFMHSNQSSRPNQNTERGPSRNQRLPPKSNPLLWCHQYHQKKDWPDCPWPELPDYTAYLTGELKDSWNLNHQPSSLDLPCRICQAKLIQTTLVETSSSILIVTSTKSSTNMVSHFEQILWGSKRPITVSIWPEF